MRLEPWNNLEGSATGVMIVAHFQSGKVSEYLLRSRVQSESVLILDNPPLSKANLTLLFFLLHFILVFSLLAGFLFFRIRTFFNFSLLSWCYLSCLGTVLCSEVANPFVWSTKVRDNLWMIHFTGISIWRSCPQAFEHWKQSSLSLSRNLVMSYQTVKHLRRNKKKAICIIRIVFNPIKTWSWSNSKNDGTNVVNVLKTLWKWISKTKQNMTNFS